MQQVVASNMEQSIGASWPSYRGLQLLGLNSEQMVADIRNRLLSYARVFSQRVILFSSVGAGRKGSEELEGTN